jgi:hypothetical protein
MVVHTRNAVKLWLLTLLLVCNLTNVGNLLVVDLWSELGRADAGLHLMCTTVATNSQWVFQASVDVTLLLLLGAEYVLQVGLFNNSALIQKHSPE